MGNSEVTPLENRIYNSTAFLTTVVLFTTSLFNELSGFPKVFNLFLAGVGIVFSILYSIARFKDLYNISKAAMVFIAVVTAPVVWHYNQGITGTSTLYFFSLTLLLISTMNKYKVLFGLFFIIYITALGILEKYIPEFVLPYENEKVAYIDSLFSFIITSIIFVLAAITLKVNYERERKKTERKSLEIIRQRDELARLNKELSEQNTRMTGQKEELESLNTTNNKLFSIISHDLRSPLANLDTLIQVITFSDPTPDESQRLMKGAQRELRYTTNLLDNLLQWAKQQREGLEINTTEFQLKSIVRENLKLIHMRLEKKGIKLEDHVIDSLYVHADIEMVRLILRNLLSNAIKFCKKDDLITISARQLDKMLQIDIKDTGCGISKKNQKKLFDTIDFSQKGTDNEKGTGLGLMLCKEFVRKNGGHIWFTSEEGEGTTFSFSLPAASLPGDFSPTV